MPTRLTIRLDFDESRRLGPGKVALLESIGGTGSISAAGRAHAMSYRKAWLLVEEMNRMFAKPLVAARKMRVGAKTEIARMERALAALG
jgi:molybdate transport system regulatory protein